MAKKLHISLLVQLYNNMPPISSCLCIKNKKLELEIEEAFGDIIQKEIEHAKMSWRKISE